MGKYGPFANIVLLASVLVAVFSTLLLKMLGNMKQWTWLTSGSPSFLVTAGPKMVAVVFMAITYVTINHSNYVWFAVAAILIVCFGFWSVVRFDLLRKLHIVSIPMVGENGRQLVVRTLWKFWKKTPVFQNVLIGLESQLRPQAKTSLDEARKQRGGLSLPQFMAGYGAQKVNDPEALWDREILAKTSNKLLVALMYIVLSSVMALFLAASIIEAAS